MTRNMDAAMRNSVLILIGNEYHMVQFQGFWEGLLGYEPHIIWRNGQ